MPTLSSSSATPSWSPPSSNLITDGKRCTSLAAPRARTMAPALPRSRPPSLPPSRGWMSPPPFSTTRTTDVSAWGEAGLGWRVAR
jgi:hypothetical protein